jgi:hypothetical protein
MDDLPHDSRNFAELNVELKSNLAYSTRPDCPSQIFYYGLFYLVEFSTLHIRTILGSWGDF